ncbi:uncharacterized [Tachysurus ichikawai]
MDLNSTINNPSHGTTPSVGPLLGSTGDRRCEREDGKTRGLLEVINTMTAISARITWITDILQLFETGGLAGLSGLIA